MVAIGAPQKQLAQNAFDVERGIPSNIQNGQISRESSDYNVGESNRLLNSPSKNSDISEINNKPLWWCVCTSIVIMIVIITLLTIYTANVRSGMSHYNHSGGYGGYHSYHGGSHGHYNVWHSAHHSHGGHGHGHGGGHGGHRG